MDTITIGDLAKTASVATRTIRFYETRGLMPRPARTSANYRLYGPDDVKRLALIRRARALGFSLTEVRDLVRAAEHERCSSFQGELARSLNAKLQEVDRLLAQLHTTRDQLAGVLGRVIHEPWGDCQQAALWCCTDEACLGSKQLSPEGRCESDAGPRSLLPLPVS